jgi:hypothetical protein
MVLFVARAATEDFLVFELLVRQPVGAKVAILKIVNFLCSELSGRSDRTLFK